MDRREQGDIAVSISGTTTGVFEGSPYLIVTVEYRGVDANWHQFRDVASSTSVREDASRDRRAGMLETTLVGVHAAAMRARSAELSGDVVYELSELQEALDTASADA